VERVSTLAHKAVLSGLMLALLVVQKRLDSAVPAPLWISPTRLVFVGERCRRWSLEPCHVACHGRQSCQEPCQSWSRTLVPRAGRRGCPASAATAHVSRKRPSRTRPSGLRQRVDHVTAARAVPCSSEEKFVASSAIASCGS
jgi:hypothetical protein